MTREEEVNIIIAIQKGKTQEFEKLVRENQSMVYNLALRMTGNPEDALDLSQEAFFRAFRALGTFRAESKFSVWLYRMASNACIDFLRTKKNDLSLSVLDEDGNDTIFEIPDTRYSPETAMERRELTRAVNKGLLELPAEQRQILIMREISGLSYEEIGTVLELPPGTVKSRLSRARSRLAEILIGSGGLGNFQSGNSRVVGNLSSVNSSEKGEGEGADE